MKRRTFLLAGSALLILPACSRKPETGPVPIRWDQETCARCGMAISDRHYAAEVRGGPEADRTRVWKFDDIGSPHRRVARRPQGLVCYRSTLAHGLRPRGAGRAGPRRAGFRQGETARV